MSQPPSLRNRLLTGVLAAMVLCSALETFVRIQALRDTVRDTYDRFLVAAVYSVADSLHAEGSQLRGVLPLALGEAFESAAGSRVYFRISNLQGDLVAGDEALPRYEIPVEMVRDGFRPVTPVLLDQNVNGQAVRMGVLYQVVEMSEGRRVAVIQVAHTLEARELATRSVLVHTVAVQAAFLLAIGVLVWWIVVEAMKPLVRLREEVDARAATDLSPLRARAPSEVQPMVDAFNHLMERQSSLNRQHERFVADASHQLRTPLTVLKTQLQSALAEQDTSARARALYDMQRTVDRASALASQMLSLARVHQVHALGRSGPRELADVVRGAAIELSPLMSAKRLRFQLQQEQAWVNADDWVLGELVRNILNNAISHSPVEGELLVGLTAISAGASVELRIEDSGPGIDDALIPRLYEPFFAIPGKSAGSGLGLAICKEIVDALAGTIALINRRNDCGVICGLRVVVTLPIAPSP
jgi:two-component system, OmpR family, sensor histidine kinase TctE